MIAPRDGADEFNQRDDYAPSPARDCLCITAKDLDAQCRSVSTWSIVGDGAEGENDDAEPTEPAETVIACKKECTWRDVIGIAPTRGRRHPSGNGHTDEIAEDTSPPDTGPCHKERDPFGSRSRVIYVEVGTNGGEPNDASEFQGEEGTAICGNGAGSTNGNYGSVKVLARGTDKNKKGD